MATCTIDVLAESLFPTRKEFVSVRELAKETSVSERTIRRRVASGELQSCKLGSRRLVRRDSLDELLKD